MKYPYLITSDQHAHSWSQFASTGPDGINTRLAAILTEMRVAHAALKERGGDQSFYAGDLFHVRGKIEPSVFNPTFEAIRDIHAGFPGLEAQAIPGNHDLEGKDATALGNAMQQLSTIPGFNVHTKTMLCGDVLVVPWYQDLNELRAILKAEAKRFDKLKHGMDVIIHAPVNGVIKGIPDHGLEAQELADLGFRRVFAGHYHDHRELISGVWSVGASSHQTWSDPGTNAGFLLVYEDRVEHFESGAPKFIDLLGHDIASQEELELLVHANYVRLKLEDATEAEIKGYKADLDKAGARGSIILVANTKKAANRTNTTVTASATLEASVGEYVAKQLKPTHLNEVQSLCAELLARAREEA
jgi:DNA repair exonuclease SbcCD nuclease subunit